MSAADATRRTQNGIRVVRWDVPTDGSAAADVDSPKLTGYLHSIRYIKNGTNPYADTVDFTITNEATGQGIWTQVNQTANAVKFPRFLANDLVGAALSSLTVAEMVLLNNESIRVVLADGGNNKIGTFEAVILPIPGVY